VRFTLVDVLQGNYVGMFNPESKRKMGGKTRQSRDKAKHLGTIIYNFTQERLVSDFITLKSWSIFCAVDVKYSFKARNHLFGLSRKCQTHALLIRASQSISMKADLSWSRPISATMFYTVKLIQRCVINIYQGDLESGY